MALINIVPFFQDLARMLPCGLLCWGFTDFKDPVSQCSVPSRFLGSLLPLQLGTSCSHVRMLVPMYFKDRPWCSAVGLGFRV